MGLIHTIIAFLVALGVLIVVHEFGHYLAARWCRVKVLRFAVGFGKPLFTYVSRGPDRTEWVLAVLPLGGYVKMLDEREAPVTAADAPRAFNRQNVWKRIVIVAAGPVANFLLAIAVYAGLYMYGVSEPKAILAAPAAQTMAARAGISDGDQVLSVNGSAISHWSDLRWALLDATVNRSVVTLEVVDARNAMATRRLDFTDVKTDRLEGDPLADVGIRLFRPSVPATIGVVRAGEPAETAGLRVGDKVLAIDDQTVTTFEAMVRIIERSPGAPLRFTLERAGAQTSLVITPRSVERRDPSRPESITRVGRIGAGAVPLDQAAIEKLTVRESLDPIAAVGRGVVKTWEMSVFSLKMLWKMLIGEVSWRNLSGPVTIADYAGQSASLGVLPYITFIALVSISLGVLNLLPIPVLDGGHLLYYFIEVVRGHPLSDRALEISQRVGMTLLLTLMVFAFYNDINRLFSG